MRELAVPLVTCVVRNGTSSSPILSRDFLSILFICPKYACYLVFRLVLRIDQQPMRIDGRRKKRLTIFMVKKQFESSSGKLEKTCFSREIKLGWCKNIMLKGASMKYNSTILTYLWLEEQDKQ